MKIIQDIYPPKYYSMNEDSEQPAEGEELKEGKIVTRFMVNERGRARSYEIIEAYPPGLEEMEKMMESLGGQEIDKTLYLGLLAETYIKFEEYGKAANTVAAGVYQVKKTGERYNEAELLRINASLIRRTDGDPREYRSLLDKAIACATRQSADSWIERAEKELGRQP